MRKKTGKITSMLLGAAMMGLLITGCSKTESTATTAAETVAETAAEETKEAQTEKKTEEKENLPKVGIAWVEDAEPCSEDVQVYINAVEKAGGEAVLLPKVENEEEAKEALATVGAVIMTGGEDISPSYYKEEANEKLEEVNEARDTSDFWMITAALEEDVPMLATCRGMQMLNAICGGTLYQDLPTQYETEIEHRDPKKVDFTKHEITVEDGNILTDVLGAETLTVNSWHHQAVKDLGEGLTVMAKAPDGIIEAVTMTEEPYVMALQFHPEWLVDDGEEEFLKFFEVLVEKAAVTE